VLPAPATFLFSADLMSSEGEAGPVEFFDGTNSLGVVSFGNVPLTADTPPYSLVVTNLAEGRHSLSVKYRGGNGYQCHCGSVTIRVTKLGIQSPSLRADGRVEFGVVTSFPGSPIVIEASPDLVNWTPVSTNVPPGNTLTFVDPFPATNVARFYRALVRSQ
jgi:hypothetical protein